MGQRAIDLTQGNIWKVIALFVLPIFLGNFFQQFYTTVDAVAVGRFAGKLGLAAIDSVYSLLKLPVNFFAGLSTGAAILISQASLHPIANMMIQASINHTGTDDITAWAMCGKLDFLIWLLADSLAAALSTFVAQNYGARQPERMRRGVRVGFVMTVGCIALLSLLLFIWCEPLGKLFVPEKDYSIIPLMAVLMRFLSPFYFTCAIGEVLPSAIRGTGETFRPMLLTLTGTCVFRVIWALLVAPRHDSIFTIIVSYPLSWILTSCLFIAYYLLFFKKAISQV